MVNRSLYLKIIGIVSLIVFLALLGSGIVDNRYLLLLILCMSVYYPVDNSVTNPVDERYKP